jgi:hypothetical protein
MERDLPAKRSSTGESRMVLTIDTIQPGRPIKMVILNVFSATIVPEYWIYIYLII